MLCLPPLHNSQSGGRDRGPKCDIYEFRQMKQPNMFEGLNGQSVSLGAKMTHTNNFVNLNGQFESLSTRMTKLNKLKDR